MLHYRGLRGFLQQNARIRLTLQQSFPAAYSALRNTQCKVAAGPANIYARGALCPLLRFAATRPTSVGWTPAASLRPHGLDNIYKFYDRTSLIPNYICRTKVQTQWTKFTKAQMMVLRPFYLLRACACEWQGSLKSWMHRTLQPYLGSYPHQVAHCILRARSLHILPMPWRSRLMNAQRYCSTFDFDELYILSDFALAALSIVAAAGLDMIRILLEHEFHAAPDHEGHTRATVSILL